MPRKNRTRESFFFSESFANSELPSRLFCYKRDFWLACIWSRSVFYGIGFKVRKSVFFGLAFVRDIA